MMNQLKHMLAFLWGGLYFAVLTALVLQWSVISQDIIAAASLIGALIMMTFFALVLVIRFYIVYWKK